MSIASSTSLGCAGFSYTWEEPWATPPPDPLAGAGWAHHGLAVTAAGLLVGAQAGGDAICLFDADGMVVGSWSTGMAEVHGLACSGSGAAERLWVADPGTTMVPDGAGGYRPHAPTGVGRVACCSLDGILLGELPAPAVPADAVGGYAPTGVAVDETDGSIWVADGYGKSLVHRFGPDGDLQLTLTGEEGAGRFECPHAVFLDTRGERRRLYVADRGNARLQVYDLHGRFLHTVSDGLRSPSALVAWGDRLVVAELHARLAVLDGDDRLVGYLGADDAAPAREGWPNAIDAGGRTVRPQDLGPGRFNSPHGLAIDACGNLYVAEWLIGGRIVRLGLR